MKVLIFSLFAALSCSSFAQVPNFAFRWWSNTAWFSYILTPHCLTKVAGVCVLWADPTPIVNAAGQYWDLTTDIDGGYGPNMEGRIRFVNPDLGPGSDLGGTQPFVNGIPCTTVGVWIPMPLVCNTTDKKPDSATVYINKRYFDADWDPDGALTRWNFGLRSLATHELGHVFALSHTLDSGSIMYKNLNGVTTLNALEIAWINSTY